MVIKRLIPSKLIYETWTSCQRRFYSQMCDTANFFKGFGAVAEMDEEFEEEIEVESDGDTSAQAMKLDNEDVGDGDITMQGAQVLGTAASSKSV